MNTAPATLPATLSEAEARALRKFQAWLDATMPGQVRRLILFGSKARGDTHGESDVDVFLELSEATPERYDRVLDFTRDLMFDDEVDLAPIVYGPDELERLIDLGAPFVRNVAKDGIPLIGEGITVGKGKPEEVARTFMESARHRLNAARLLLEGSEWRDAVSRAYYAALDAADGALAIIGIAPQSHAGTLNLFSLHLVKPGRVEGRYGGLLNQIQKWRLEADYQRMQPVTEERARAAFAIAQDFVAVVEALLPD
ncbi:MAG: HEPN domain-containing protein, partial [Chloroflexi bacterium]|nr:HEPN domain-containing protein [Chloroflexota bacterium]